MLSHLQPSSSISPSIASILPPLVAKETHDVAISTLTSTLPAHISFLLNADTAVPKETTALLAKEMNNAKPPIRRAFCSTVGTIFWQLGDLPSQASQAFASAVLPAFETNIKNVMANPLNATAGPLEGYIALAVLLGPLARSDQFGEHREMTYLSHFWNIHLPIFIDSTISRNAAVQSLSSSSNKPSFLFWDKIFQKLTDPDDEIWLLRACEGALSYLKSDLAKNELLR